MPPFHDHFSGHAFQYASARPGYPGEVFAWLAEIVPARSMAWDAGTGNGQAAAELSGYFDRVYATDASAEQVAQAPEVEGVEFRAEPAEEPSLPDASVDLVTVAQAAHWFDLDRFFASVKRVLTPGGALAMWCYERCLVGPEVDSLLDRYYESLDAYWPPQRQMVETGYRTIDFPFREIVAPAFHMERKWGVEQMLAYLGSWSASQRCQKETGRDPIEPLRSELSPAWGDGVRLVHWPVSMRVGYVN